VTLQCFMQRPVCHLVGALAVGLFAVAFLAGPVLAQTVANPDSIRPPKISDPGPRPIGNQGIAVKGAIFNTGVADTIQPKDADGNGAGRQLPKLTPDQTAFWFASLVVFGDVLEAIAAHQSPESEANAVIRNFNELTDTQKQDMLNFLRSL
jgi:hypothetical protein